MKILFFLLNSHFYFIYLHCYGSISSLNGVTLWKLIFPILVPHWILVVTFVCTVITVHGSFHPFWTLLCGVYRSYGIIYFMANVIPWCYCDLFGEACSLQFTSELRTGHQRLCLVWVFLLHLASPCNIVVVCFVNSPCCIVNECINVSRFNWIGHVDFRGAHHHLMDALTDGK